MDFILGIYVGTGVGLIISILVEKMRQKIYGINCRKCSQRTKKE